MKDIKIVKNYASALFSGSSETGAQEEVLKQMIAVNEVVESDVVIKNAIQSPIIKNTDKVKIIQSIMQKFNINNILAEFLLLLVKNSRISLLSKIISFYHLMLDESKDIKLVQVVSFKILELEEKEWIKNHLENLLKQKVETEFSENQSILGGMVIEYDSIRMDYSIAGALGKIKKLTMKSKINFLVEPEFSHVVRQVLPMKVSS